MYRAAVTLMVALVVGCLVLSWAGLPASAQTTAPKPRLFDPVSAQEKRVFDEIIKKSYGSDPAKASTARNILTRQAKKTVPRLGGSLLARGGLAGAAAGVWTVVGLELYYLPCWECTPAKSVAASDVRISDGAMSGRYGITGTRETQAWVTHYSLAVNPNNSSGMLGTIITQRNVVTWQKLSNPTRWFAPTVSTSMTQTGEGTQFTDLLIQQETVPTNYQKIQKLRTPTGNTVYSPVDITVYASPQKVTRVCQTGVCTKDVLLPTFEFGDVKDGSTGGDAAPFKTTPGEGNAFINNVVADPATKPLVDPMDVPDPAVDPDWDPNTDPFNPLFDPFADPEGDPDGDGIPNRDDPDPEEDGDPDGDGDPNEHPVIAPWPNTDDPEEDGDPDGDGDPNETRPSPVPTDLPIDDPDADPDQDGEPNKDDTDDDGDGIPDVDDPSPFVPTDPVTLPQDHPYADPDKDGKPNKDDTDDDGDGVPDTEDPAPYDPDVPGPGELPDDHPDSDPDKDGTPNKDDTDDDGDGVPDEDDPAPYDPDVPANDPNFDRDNDGVPDKIDPDPGDPLKPSEWRKSDRDGDFTPDPYDPAEDDPADPDINPTRRGDTDQDGTPNQHDPYPGDPAKPKSPTTDIDNDGTPTFRDTDPYRPSSPGDPTTDPDLDGVPTSQDPFPGDPNEPNNPDDGGFCPIPKKPSFDVPQVKLGSVFPFSLVLYVWDGLGDLTRPASAPTFNLGAFGAITFPASSGGAVSIIRGCIGFVAVMGMMLFFYRHVSGKGGE